MSEMTINEIREHKSNLEHNVTEAVRLLVTGFERVTDLRVESVVLIGNRGEEKYLSDADIKVSLAL